MTTAERPTLSREVISATALRLTDEVGLAGLSMRKLGAELGVEAMSLYHYVANKDDLLGAVLDHLYAEIDLPRDVADDEWEEAIRCGMHALHDVLLRHPAALELFSTRPAPSMQAVEVMYWAYRRFELMGLDPAAAYQAFRFAVSYVMGHAANEIGALAITESDEIDLDEVPDPDYRAFLAHHQEVDSAQLFLTGVDTVIAGLQARFDLP